MREIKNNKNNNGNMVRLTSLNHKINRKGMQAEKIRLALEDMVLEGFEDMVLEEDLEKAVVFFEETVKTPVGDTVHKYLDDAWDAVWEDPNPEASYWC